MESDGYRVPRQQSGLTLVGYLAMVDFVVS